MVTVMVIVELPDPGAGMVCGLKLTLVPDGAPEAERLTAPLNPPVTVLVMVVVPGLPCTILTEPGEADNSKSWEATTVSVTVVLCFTPPPLPVTVMG